jgi:hypothetical protein
MAEHQRPRTPVENQSRSSHGSGQSGAVTSIETSKKGQARDPHRSGFVTESTLYTYIALGTDRCASTGFPAHHRLAQHGP